MPNVKEELKQLRSDNDNLRKMIVNLKKWEIREEEMVQKITGRVVENIVEVQEKEKRKNNIVMFNVPESKEDEAKDTDTKSVAMCESIFHDVIKIRDAKIVRASRIGKGKEGKARPLVLELNDVGVK